MPVWEDGGLGMRVNSAVLRRSCFIYRWEDEKVFFGINENERKERERERGGGG
jgi:hypothetical protein